MAINREAPYFKVAKIALINWNSKTPEEADKFLKEKSVSEIERAVIARGSMTDAAMHIGEKLGLSTYESYVFTQEMLGLTSSTAMTDLVTDRVQHELASRSLDEARNFAADLLISTADKTHAGWTERKSVEFFGAKDVKDQQYQYTTSDFIGFAEVQSDLFFITPIAEAIGIPVNEEDLLQKYHDVTIENLRALKEQGVEIEGVGGPGVDTVREMISSSYELEHGTRNLVTRDVQLAVTNDGLSHENGLVDQITTEVMSKGIGQDSVLMDRLIDEGILNKEDPDGLDDFDQEIGDR